MQRPLLAGPSPVRGGCDPSPDRVRLFRPPPLRPDLVARPDLRARIEAAADRPLLVLSAPAGYGKTTLLAQWAHDGAEPVVWLDAVDAHTDPVVLLADLIAALSEVAPGLQELAGPVRPDSAFSTRVLPRLARALRCAEGAFRVVVDDAHRLTAPECRETLEVLAGNLPPGGRLALAYRTAPALRMGMLRAARLVDVLGPSELSASPAVARELLAEAGLPVTVAELDQVMALTEGWPAGLVLAAMAVRDAPDRREAIAALAGDDRRIADYFADEVLARVSAEESDLLVRTAVLDTLSAPACTAVLGVPVTVDALRALERDNRFVMSLDRRGERFRHHHMFAEMLRGELRRRDPAGVHELHARAAAWHLAEGDVPAAVRHLVRAGDLEEAALVTWRAVPAMQSAGRLATLRAMIAAFPQAEVRSRPALALAAGWTAAETDGELVGHWARLAATALARRDASAPLTRELIANHALLRAHLCADGVPAMVRDAREAFDGTPDDSPWRAVACLLVGVGTHLRGDAEAARPWIREGIERAGALVPIQYAFGLTWLGVMRLMEVGIGGSEGFARRARGAVEDAGIGEYPTTALLDGLEALLAAQRGDLAAARRGAAHARALLARIAHVTPWYAVACRVLLARAAAQTGDDDAARTLIAEAGEYRALVAGAPVLERAYDDCRAALDGLPAGAAAGPGALTTAELRVLAFLPTHLTFREIGERIHLSRFTIKSQALAAYRKLGVASRSEAVARARALGILDG